MFACILDEALNALPVTDITFPWKQNCWREIFKPQSLCIDPVQKFTRPIFHDTPAAPSIPVESDPKRQRTVAKLVSGWVDIVRPGADIRWEEECEAKMQVALKRWLEACLIMPKAIVLRQLLDQQVDIQSQLRLIRNLLWKKAPSTLVKRVNSLFRYLKHLQECGVDFPGTESDLYQFLILQQDAMVSSARLQGVIEALNFCQRVLDIPELSGLTCSRRCAGVAASQRGGVKRQAAPFKVEELLVLHRIVCSQDENLWDRIFSGSVLIMVYSRSRWSDLQRAESMVIDRDNAGVLHYLEGIISSHKCVHSAVFKNVFLHAVAPCLGVVDDQWAEQWLSCRTSMNLEVGKLPLMPSPDTSGVPTRRPLSTTEMGLWVRHLLVKAGCAIGDRRLSSHSCKVTLLSYASTFGLEWNDRLILGGHVGPLKSAIVYSRDCLARPLQLLAGMLSSIRFGEFQPDQTRSGRFVQIDKRSADDLHSLRSWSKVDGSPAVPATAPSAAAAFGDDSLQVVISDEEPVKEEAGSETGCSIPQDLDVVSSDDELGNTDSSSDESAGEECPTKRLVRPPSAPSGYSLIQHSKLKTLHLLPADRERILACGRGRSAMHIDVGLQVRWDTPCCHVCWKKVKGL